jgi:FAD-NAD(P)-binding
MPRGRPCDGPASAKKAAGHNRHSGLQGDIRNPIRAMTAARIPTIALAGAGFSGSLLAVHLTRQSVGPLEIVMIDRNGSRGRGLAYSADNPNHLLNVRV